MGGGASKGNGKQKSGDTAENAKPNVAKTAAETGWFFLIQTSLAPWSLLYIDMVCSFLSLETLPTLSPSTDHDAEAGFTQAMHSKARKAQEVFALPRFEGRASVQLATTSSDRHSDWPLQTQ